MMDVLMPNPDLEFTVIDSPAAQGSKRHVGHGRMIEMSKKIGPWRQSVIGAARAAMSEQGGVWSIDAPVVVHAVFSLPRPKSAPKSVLRPAKTPDLDKLMRGLLDPMTMAGVWTDDARVVSMVAHKVFAGSDSPDALDVPGVVVRLWRF